jgi:hypothetical protein
VVTEAAGTDCVTTWSAGCGDIATPATVVRASNDNESFDGSVESQALI